jgi:hypothetical protein
LPDPDAKASEKAGSGYHSTVSRSLLIVVAAGCTVAIQGCRPADPRSRDSAGIRIVENPSRRTAPVAFRLGQVAFDVGGLDTNQDNEFNPRQGQMRAAVMSSGHFAVTDVNRIHIFDETGKRLRIVGRSGRGPEEFGNIVSICRARGDTLVVGDSPNGRVAILDSAGRFVRTISDHRAWLSRIRRLLRRRQLPARDDPLDAGGGDASLDEGVARRKDGDRE